MWLRKVSGVRLSFTIRGCAFLVVPLLIHGDGWDTL
jgi:hypothetical protein